MRTEIQGRWPFLASLAAMGIILGWTGVSSAWAEEAVILTPQPPPTPRINGARVFGVRPGHPLLFTIPATGRRPIEFAVDNLPAGLRLDPRSGQISGSLDTRGAYAVTFRARNALGEARRKFKIVCGDVLALTPHMGWNSWYIWEDRVSDKIVRAAADAMVSTGLIDHGYQYVNIDDGWMVKQESADPVLGGQPRDAAGNINPNRRFPDMKALTAYIHGKGLKAGIYTAVGQLTCCRGIGSYGHEEQDARRFAHWGFDFLKLDWCFYFGPVPNRYGLPGWQEPYRLMGDALRRLDRDVVFNFVPNTTGRKHIVHWARSSGGHSWRTAVDLVGRWENIQRDGFDLYGRNELQKLSGPGGWNDPDYLSLGYISDGKGGSRPTPLSPGEQYSYVSLWCLLSAPLILSGDITRLDDFTLGLLTNDEVLEVDQDPLGKAARRAAKAGELEVWAKDMEDGTKAVGLFNRGEREAAVTAEWSGLGLAGKQTVRDLWRQRDLGTFEGRFSAAVGRHGVVLLRIRPAQ